MCSVPCLEERHPAPSSSSGSLGCGASSGLSECHACEVVGENVYWLCWEELGEGRRCFSAVSKGAGYASRLPKPGFASPALCPGIVCRSAP